MKLSVFGAKRKQAGFSLVELMIVVAIIGILAALAVPRFQNFQAKARQAEAKNNLSHIYTLQQTYFGDNSSYTTNMRKIGFQVDGKQGGTSTNTLVFGQYYNYAMTSAGGGAFVANARAITTNVIKPSCGSTDTWQITDRKLLTSLTNCVEIGN